MFLVGSNPTPGANILASGDGAVALPALWEMLPEH
jgi:hypothetical protein